MVTGGRRHAVVVLFAGLLAACAVAQPEPDTARVTQPAFGSNGDPDIAALDLAAWAFARAANLRGDPTDAARAVAAVDYIAGDLSVSPRWIAISPVIKTQMLQARTALRAALHIPPDARSQRVVDTMNAVADALSRGQDGAARDILRRSGLTASSELFLAQLGAMPFLPAVNVATMNAAAASNPGGECGLCQ